MPRIQPIDPDHADAETAALFGQVRQVFGGNLPNLMRTFATSPRVLAGWLHLAAELSQTLPPTVAQQIAVAVAQANNCEYCLSANTAAGRAVGVSAEDLDAARDGKASDPKIDALLEFVRDVVILRGEITDGQFDRVRSAGWTDGQLTEAIGLIAMNTMMNLTNSVAETDNDWPLLTIGRQQPAPA